MTFGTKYKLRNVRHPTWIWSEQIDGLKHKYKIKIVQHEYEVIVEIFDP